MSKQADLPFEIRTALSADAPAIHQVMVAAAEALSDHGLFFADDEVFIAEHLETRGFILVAWRQGKIVGFIIARLPGPDEDNLGRELGLVGRDLSRVAHLESVAVEPAYQGEGLGRLLMVRAEDRLTKAGFTRLMATVAPGNLVSLHNFEALGYRIMATQLKYGGLPRHILLKEVGKSFRL
jgi:ribosomal protein S18 acetylase RimI-like enzyme